MEWKLESVVSIASPSKIFNVQTHNWKNFRLSTCLLPGPLCSLSIVVPTKSWNHSGLAHTLEHLVFCGSKNYPWKGYLDSLANRAIANGTNAYTSEDHTCYTLTNATFPGLLDVLPVYLDHVLQPIIDQKHFDTEVFSLIKKPLEEEDSTRHGDSFGGKKLKLVQKKTGVVYSEMSARAFTEADLLDNALREALYGKNHALSYECGGRPVSIERLSVGEIKKYHDYYYDPSKVSVIISGPIQVEKIIDVLEQYFGTAYKEKNQRENGNQALESSDHPYPPSFTNSSTVQYFPCNDENLGSIGLCMPGPPLTDYYSIVALNVLIKYLSGSNSSPIYQKFVESNPPIANSVDFEIKMYEKTALFIVFSGITNGADKGASEVESDSGSIDTNSSHSSAGSSTDADAGEKINYLDQECIQKMLYDLITKVKNKDLEPSSTGISLIHKAIQQTREKHIENLEEHPHGCIYSAVLYDTLQVQNADKVSPIRIGEGMNILPLLDKLEMEPLSYWTSLLETYFLGQMHEVIMIPKRDYFDLYPHLKLDNEIIMETEAHLENGTVVDHHEAKTQKLNYPDNTGYFKDIELFPCQSKIISSAQHVDIFDLAGPFRYGQLVESECALIHFTIMLDLSHVPFHLLKYLVLFQELLFSSPLEFSSEPIGLEFKGKHLKSSYRVPYTEVIDKLSDLFISYDSGLGFGNDTFSASYMSQCFVIQAVCTPLKYPLAIKTMLSAIHHAVPDQERLLVMASNVYSQLIETLRDGPDVMEALLIKHTPLADDNMRVSTLFDDQISIFNQETFLKNDILDKRDDIEALRHHLDQLTLLKEYLVSSNKIEKSSCIPGFFQFGVPSNGACSPSEIVNLFLNTWASYKNNSDALNQGHPYFIHPMRYPFVECISGSVPPQQKFTLCGIGGLTTTHMTASLKCDVFDPAAHGDDYHAIALFCELLSRTEGPLYDRIRGNGLAYGVSLSLALWNRSLAFSLYDSIDPVKGIMQFQSLFSAIEDEISSIKDNESGILARFNIETAMASSCYSKYSSQSCPSSVFSHARKSLFRGFKSEAERAEFDKRLFHVTRDDLIRVYRQYFAPFMDFSRCVAVLVCEPSRIEELKNGLANIGIANISTMTIHKK